jgi:hypothetical protein
MEKKEKSKGMEQKYRLTLTEPMLGTIPKNKEVFTRYIASERTGEDEIANIPPGEESGYTGFYTKEDGIYLYDYHIKGFLKEAGNILKEALEIRALKSKLDNYLFVFPRSLRLKDKPDGINERPLRAMTAAGPRISLAKSDYVDAGTTIEVTIKLLPHQELTQELIETLLDYGAFKGLGQWRNASWGRFTWERLS